MSKFHMIGAAVVTAAMFAGSTHAAIVIDGANGGLGEGYTAIIVDPVDDGSFPGSYVPGLDITEVALDLSGGVLSIGVSTAAPYAPFGSPLSFTATTVFELLVTDSLDAPLAVVSIVTSAATPPTATLVDFTGGPPALSPLPIIDLAFGSDLEVQVPFSISLPGVTKVQARLDGTGFVEDDFTEPVTTVIPEPASLALLALGGAMILRRR